MGLNYAFEIISAQAKGAGNIELIGIYLNRARVTSLLLCIPLFIFLNNTANILIWMGLNKNGTAKISQEYVLAYFPALVL